MTVRDSSLVTLKEPQGYDPALGAKRGRGWFLGLGGRPSGRMVCSNLNSLAVRLTHSSSPKGRPLDAHPHAPEFLRAQRRIYAIGPIHGAFHRDWKQGRS